MTNAPEDTDLPEVWQQRFDFFRRYGQVGTTPEAKAAYRALPFLAKAKLAFNIWAFLFGPIYFFVKGMWRKGLTLLGILVVLDVVLVFAPMSDRLSTAIGTGYAVVMAMWANWAYYLHVTRDSQSWNPFERFSRAE